MALPDHVKGIVITGLGVLILTPDGLLVRLIEADQWTILFWRGLLSGGFILGALAVIQRGMFLAKLRSIGAPGIVFAVIFGVGTVCFVLALFLTSVANVLFIFAASPLFSAMFSPLYLKEPVSRNTWFAILFAMIGVGIIVSGSFERGAGSVLGDLFALGASISVAATFIIARKWRDRSMVPAMGLAGIVTALIALPFAAPYDVAGDTEIYILLMGAVVAVATGMMTMGPRFLPAPEVGLLLLFEAVIGPYWVWLILGENPGASAIIGGCVVLMTLVVLNSLMLWRGRGKTE